MPPASVESARPDPCLRFRSITQRSRLPVKELGDSKDGLVYVFDTLGQVREITESWLREHNEERPHDSLGRVLPLMFLPRPQLPAESGCKLCA